RPHGTLCARLAAGEADHRRSRLGEGILRTPARRATRLPARRPLPYATVVDCAAHQQLEPRDHDFCPRRGGAELSETMHAASRSQPRPELSLVVPVFNEISVLPEFYQRASAALNSCCKTYEIIFVDDGSSDGSLDALRRLAGTDARVRVLSFSRNFGH